MVKDSRTWRFGSLLVAAAFFAAACGSTANSGELSELDPNASDGPGTADACLVGERECNDTPPVDAEVTDLPDNSTPEETDPTTDEPEVTDKPVEQIHTGNTVDGGLTVSEALATDATGILAVKGQLFDDGTGMRLCERLIGLGERYGCDGASVEVVNLDTEAASGFLIFHEGTTFTEGPITLFGELVDGSLLLGHAITS